MTTVALGAGIEEVIDDEPAGLTVEDLPDILPTRWDTGRAKKRSDPARADRHCINCRRPADPRYLYCSDKCSRASRDRQKGKG